MPRPIFFDRWDAYQKYSNEYKQRIAAGERGTSTLDDLMSYSRSRMDKFLLNTEFYDPDTGERYFGDGALNYFRSNHSNKELYIRDPNTNELYSFSRTDDGYKLSSKSLDGNKYPDWYKKNMGDFANEEDIDYYINYLTSGQAQKESSEAKQNDPPFDVEKFPDEPDPEPEPEKEMTEHEKALADWDKDDDDEPEMEETTKGVIKEEPDPELNKSETVIYPDLDKVEDNPEKTEKVVEEEEPEKYYPDSEDVEKSRIEANTAKKDEKKEDSILIEDEEPNNDPALTSVKKKKVSQVELSDKSIPSDAEYVKSELIEMPKEKGENEKEKDDLSKLDLTNVDNDELGEKLDALGVLLKPDDNSKKISVNNDDVDIITPDGKKEDSPENEYANPFKDEEENEYANPFKDEAENEYADPFKEEFGKEKEAPTEPETEKSVYSPADLATAAEPETPSKVEKPTANAKEAPEEKSPEVTETPAYPTADQILARMKPYCNKNTDMKQLEANVRSVCDNMTKSTDNIINNCEKGEMFASGSDIRNIALYSALCNGSMNSGKIDLFSSKNLNSVSNYLSRYSSDINYAADHKHDPSFYMKNVLDPDKSQKMFGEFTNIVDNTAQMWSSVGPTVEEEAAHLGSPARNHVQAAKTNQKDLTLKTNDVKKMNEPEIPNIGGLKM